MNVSVNTTGAEYDEWDQGTVNKVALWLFYIIVNYSAAIFNFLLVWSILQSKKRSAGDILTIGLCSGDFFMSIPCATQCLLNLIGGHNRFEHGTRACSLEAFFHVSAIMVQFISIALIAFRTFCAVVLRKDFSNSTAWFSLGVMWIICEMTTYTVGSSSDIYLMPAGEYCFYKFTSDIIVYWFTPIMILSLIGIICFYFSIFWLARQANKAVHQTANVTGPKIMTMKVAKRTFLYVINFFLGWFPAVVACFYAINHGYITQALDATLGINGSLHSLTVPMVYGYNNVKFLKWLARFRFFAPFLPQYKRRRVNGRETVITVYPPEEIPSEKKPTLRSSKIVSEHAILSSIDTPTKNSPSPIKWKHNSTFKTDPPGSSSLMSRTITPVTTAVPVIAPMSAPLAQSSQSMFVPLEISLPGSIHHVPDG